MGLLARGVGWLNDRLETAAGVPVTYSRSADGLAADVTAEVGRTLFSRQGYGTGGTAAAVEWGDRDYLVRVADLAAFGEPRTGDTVTETVNGVVMTFEVRPPYRDEPAWRYADPERTTYRLHVKKLR